VTKWGNLAERYEGKEKRKHRLLALDGGGIRGVLTLEILNRMEKMLAEATGKGSEFRLCHFFDYIAGNSTGAIIAAGLARGMSTRELQAFYEETGPAMFDKQFILKRWKAKYKSEPLKNELQKTFGADTTLNPNDLQCLLMVVTKNHTTDSPWPISSNPKAKYNDTNRKDCNLQIPLWKLVRASTAAPIYFPPEVIEWDPNDETKTFVFVDGGMTPYNNPAFLLYRMATHPGYRLNWITGEDKLLLVSVGSGAAATLDEDVNDSGKRIWQNAWNIPIALMYSAMVDQDTLCRQIGRCIHGAELDREIGDMIPRSDNNEIISSDENLGRRFLYARYNADISRDGLMALGLPDIDPSKVKKLDSIKHIGDLRRVGAKVAEEIKIDHFENFIE